MLIECNLPTLLDCHSDMNESDSHTHAAPRVGHARMYDMLAEVSRLLTSLSALELDERLPHVLGMIGTAVAADHVLVYTFTDTPGELLITHR